MNDPALPVDQELVTPGQYDGLPGEVGYSTSQWKLFDTLGDGVYGIDCDGRSTFANGAALAMLGYQTIGEVLGRNMHQLIHHTHLNGTAYQVEDCPLVSTLRTGQPVRLDNELLWRRDGTSFFAEAHPTASCSRFATPGWA